jgi:8-oxo-dGTP pyrophosphatase MutT (NUDIX family)
MSHWSTRHRVLLAVYAVVIRDGHVLLLRRAGTGYMNGKLSLPSGHVEAKEAALPTMIREAQEEVGLELSPSDLRLAHTMHRQAEEGGHEYIDLYFKATAWRGVASRKIGSRASVVGCSGRPSTICRTIWSPACAKHCGA